MKTKVIGKQILTYDEVTSTNDVLKELAIQGAEEGTAVLARMQTKGRGRRGRVWTSVPGKGMYMSVLLRPGIPAAEAGLLAVLGGVAMIRALESFELRALSLKWPNDVLARGRKIAGILVEPRVGMGMIEFAVVGMGINVEQEPEDWTDALKQIATSCHMEGVRVTCEQVTRSVLNELDVWYPLLQQSYTERLMKEWIRKGGKTGIPMIE